MSGRASIGLSIVAGFLRGTGLQIVGPPQGCANAALWVILTALTMIAALGVALARR